jgi:hypothetical protein
MRLLLKASHSLPVYALSRGILGNNDEVLNDLDFKQDRRDPSCACASDQIVSEYGPPRAGFNRWLMP